jgi:hypothetical protein
VSASSFETNSITKSKDIVVLLMLKCVLVHVYTAISISKTSVSEELVGLGWWVYASRVEIFFNCYTSVYILEDSNLLSKLILLYLKHFPTEHQFNATLVALIKRYLICVWELVDLFVRSPVLDS